MLLYICCKQENNNCNKKEDCKRYLNAVEDNASMTLFKYACTEENNYHLFMEKDDIKEENKIEDSKGETNDEETK